MIEQQINLYQDRFREKRLWVSASQLSTLLLMVIVGIAAWSYHLHTEFAEAQRRNLEIKADKDRMSAELAAANSELTRHLKQSRLDQDISDTARKISLRRKVLNFVDVNQFGSGEGFSDYLVALSNLHLPDVWLTQIRLRENFVQIMGSSLKADQVPEYFARFGDEAVFRGNRFDLFRLSRSDESAWKVDFVIATSGQGES
jgi:hypothetical protein